MQTGCPDFLNGQEAKVWVCPKDLFSIVQSNCGDETLSYTNMYQYLAQFIVTKEFLGAQRGYICLLLVVYKVSIDLWRSLSYVYSDLMKSSFLWSKMPHVTETQSYSHLKVGWSSGKPRCRTQRRSLSWRVSRTVSVWIFPTTPPQWCSSCLHPEKHINFIHGIYSTTQRKRFDWSRSYHHEVQLAISAARSFKFKRDATKLCPRLAWYGGGESDGKI